MPKLHTSSNYKHERYEWKRKQHIGVRTAHKNLKLGVPGEFTGGGGGEIDVDIGDVDGVVFGIVFAHYY